MDRVMGSAAYGGLVGGAAYGGPVGGAAYGGPVGSAAYGILYCAHRLHIIIIVLRLADLCNASLQDYNT
jgi:hypothetical protein